jgi:hypothetical protein
MSYVEPNSNPILLVDDFIRYAKAHLLTVSGQASVLSAYQPPLPPAPSIARWTGYKIPDVQSPALDTIPASTNFKSDALVTRDRFFKEPDEIDYEQEFRTQGVPSRYTRVDGISVVNSSNTAQTNFVSTNAEAKAAAEAYLGRAMSDSEWNNLVSITFAESTTNQTERAWVMGTILNRTRIGYTPAGPKNPRFKFATITDIISQPFQYQPVTGTRFKPGPVAAFVNGPNAFNANSIYGAAAKILNDVPKTFINFTSNDLRAYGPGTNPGYLTELRSRPNSKIIGGTIFAE